MTVHNVLPFGETDDWLRNWCQYVYSKWVIQVLVQVMVMTRKCTGWLDWKGSFISSQQSTPGEKTWVRVSWHKIWKWVAITPQGVHWHTQLAGNHSNCRTCETKWNKKIQNLKY